MAYLNSYVGASGADYPPDPGDENALDCEAGKAASSNLEARRQINAPPPEVVDPALKPATVSKAQKKKKEEIKGVEEVSSTMDKY